MRPVFFLMQIHSPLPGNPVSPPQPAELQHQPTPRTVRCRAGPWSRPKTGDPRRNRPGPWKHAGAVCPSVTGEGSAGGGYVGPRHRGGLGGSGIPSNTACPQSLGTGQRPGLWPSNHRTWSSPARRPCPGASGPLPPMAKAQGSGADAHSHFCRHLHRPLSLCLIFTKSNLK